ncbi:hypothetical protein DUNSADRAFT_12416 [Dunaliella salina]|uniref:PDZ domain-containing protein n=1 Tax=Dunaliella salina TaxID=3046 RepID=A0ABQ7GBA2_DUNSA|nr:hypothetical protein DUNSADRAFT_12416 [Dunaliella salina]|eukprot:KAF5831879.1 hypothetical protein DUNSADRAFT_12416 [Dunaliella salina]
MFSLKPLGFNLLHRNAVNPCSHLGRSRATRSTPQSLRCLPGSSHTNLYAQPRPHPPKDTWSPAQRKSASLNSSSGSGPHLQDFQQGLQQLVGRAVGALVAASICISGVPFGVAPAQAKLTPDEMSTIKVFNTSKPSVVSVTNLALRRDAFTMNMMEFPQGVGSGFIWDEEGHVVTNYHVINDSTNVKVTLGTDELLATVVGVDADKDIAVLQVLPATILPDPMINTKKDPKAVGTSLSRLPALSDVDWAPGSSSSSSSNQAASVDDIISRASANRAASVGEGSSLGAERTGVVSTSVDSWGNRDEGWSGWRGGADGPAIASNSNAAVRASDTLSATRSSSSSGSGAGWDGGANLVETAALSKRGAELQGQQQQNSIAPEPTLKKPPALPEGEGTQGMVLKVPEAMETMRPLCLAATRDLMVGQKVYAVGNPFGLDHTLTMGVVSGTGREIQSLTGRPINEVVQTDAAINPGNSGGPLLDSSGCVIGIATAIYSSSGQNSGVGFAIPTDVIRVSVEQILKYGKVVRPIVGITFAPDQASEQLGVKGIMVLNAVEGGPAWKAGIQGTARDEFGRLVLGDIIRGANGQPVRSAADLYKQLDKSKVGDKIDLEVLRGSSIQHVDVTLEANQTPPSQNIVIIEPKMVPVPVPEP